MATTMAAATPTAPGPTITSSAIEGAKRPSPSASSTLAPPRTTSPRASPAPGSTKPPRPHVSTARNSPAAPASAADVPQPPPSSVPAASGTEAITSTEGAAPTERLNTTSNGAGGNGNGQLPSPPSPTPTGAGVAVTTANVSAPGGVNNIHNSKSPASGAGIVGGAVPPSSTAGSRTAPSLSHNTQHPRPTSSAVEPPPPSSLNNRAPEPMRRPYATRNDRYSTLDHDAALQRISELEDVNRTLRNELDRARAAPPPSSPAMVSAAVVEAIAVYERESMHLEARSREARENFTRVLSGLVGHSRGRDRDVLSSAMIPAGERDWRDSPTDHRHLSHSHHSLQRAQSSPIFLPQSAPHHAERGHLPPPSSSRHIEQHAYAYLPSRPSPRPAHDRSQPQPPPVINLPPSNSTSSHHGHHSRTGSNTIPSGFDFIRERKDPLTSFTREHLAQTGEKRPRAPSVGAEFSSGGGRDRREEKRLRVSREGDWVKRGSGSPRKDEDRTIGNGDDFPGTRRKNAGPPSKGGAPTAGWPREHQAAARGISSGPIPPPTDGADQAEGEDAVGSPDSEIAEAVGLRPTSAKRDNDEALDDEMLVLVGERPSRVRRESTATGAGRGEETDGEVDEMILETVGATSSDRPQRRDPYANDRDRWHDDYASARYARGREGSAKPLGHHPSSGSSHSPINSYPSPAHHHQHGSDRDRGYIFRNMHPGGMESVSQQRGSVSFPHHASVGGESTQSSSRGIIYPPGQEPPNNAGGTRIPHFLPPQLGPPQPKKIYHSKSITLPPGSGSISGGPGSATAGPPGPGGNAIRGPGPGPPNGQPVRTCKSCGEPGRYKDGRCVEKWGPGPHGPGTVCDRCRKKMKRVEKRSGMEAAAAAAQNNLAAAGGHGVHYVQGHPYPRVDHPPERSGSFAMSQQDEYSQSTVALDDPQSQAYEGRSQGYYGQDHYRSERILPPPHRHHLTRRESSQSGSSQEHHRDDRGRRSGLPFHHDAPLTSGGASSAGGEYNTVLPPRRQRADGDSYREDRGQDRERERRSEVEQRDTSRRNSREDEDDDADGDAEMDQLEEDPVDPVRNKVKKEDS